MNEPGITCLKPEFTCRIGRKICPITASGAWQWARFLPRWQEVADWKRC